MHPVNFRDVGEALGLWLEPPPVRVGRLFRGGRFDSLTRLEELGNPRTILNLRRGNDPEHLGVPIIHVPAPDDLENYNTRERRVSDWIRQALSALSAPGTSWPVYIHCTSGRDRTGVIVAAVLVALGVPATVVQDEYLLSDRADAILIGGALDGLTSLKLTLADREALVRSLGAAG
jgi:protein-tyrosine phosphatase